MTVDLFDINHPNTMIGENKAKQNNVVNSFSIHTFISDIKSPYTIKYTYN